MYATFVRDTCNISLRLPVTVSSSLQGGNVFSATSTTGAPILTATKSGLVGIGTSTPVAALHVRDSWYADSSNVGIGTTAPQATVHSRALYNADVIHKATHVVPNPINLPLSGTYTADNADVISTIDVGSIVESPRVALQSNAYSSYYATASSSNFANQPYAAFNKTAENGTIVSRWTSANTYAFGSGGYIGVIRTLDYAYNKYSGEWLQIDLPYAIALTSYSITPQSTPSLSNMPATWYIFGSRDGRISWSNIDSRFAVTWPNATPQTFTIASPYNSNLYTSYRIVCSNITAGTSVSLSIAEWRLFANPSISYPKYKATFTSRTTPIGAGTYSIYANTMVNYSYSNANPPINLIDGYATTVWQTASNIYNNATAAPLPPTVNIDTTNSVRITGYTLRAPGTDVAQAPTSWLLQGSANNGATWVTLDARDNNLSLTTGAAQTFAVNTSNKYNRYRFQFLKNNSYVPNAIVLSELSLLGITEETRIYTDELGRVGIGTQPIAQNQVTLRTPAFGAEFGGNLQVNGIIDASDGFSSMIPKAVHLPLTNTTNGNQFIRWLDASCRAARNSTWARNNQLTFSTLTAPVGERYPILMKDGRLFFAVRFAQEEHYIFNPYTNTFTGTGLLGDSTLGTNLSLYSGGALLNDGRIIFTMLRNFSRIDIYDPITNSVTIIPIKRNLYFNTNMFSGSIVIPDGRVIFIPYDFTYIGIFNPNNNEYTELSCPDNGFYGGVLLKDGRVLFVPFDGYNIGIFNPLTNTYSSVTISQNNWWRGCLLPDGNVLFVNYSVNNLIGIFNSDTNTFKIITIYTNNYSGYTYPTLASDGRVILLAGYNFYTIYDHYTSEFSSYKLSTGMASFKRAILIPDGRVITTPEGNNNMVIISGFPSTTLERCIHPCFNRV